MDDTINTAQNVVSENDLIIENLSASPKNDDGYFGVQENVTENTITNVEANQTNVDIQNENISDDNGISDDESNQGTEIAEEVKLQEITQEENQEENQEVIERELTEDEKLALELKQVNEELATLEAEIEKGEVVIEVNNLFDTQEGDDEVGVSGVYDDYKREILDDVFENRLRMSVNDIKLAYSKIKNGILSYKTTKQRYCGVSEIFTLDKKAVFQLEIDDDCIKIYFVYEGELNKDEYRYSLVSDKAHLP